MSIIYKKSIRCLLFFLLMLSILSCRWDAPTGQLVDNTGCKTWENSDDLVDSQEPAFRKECFTYEYDDAANLLYLTHVNTLFNCCPDIATDLDVSNNTITVKERGDGMCDCYCLFDLEYEIKHLDAGTYTVTVDGFHYDLEFSIDLTTSPSGEYCEDREDDDWYRIEG
jgi:hypothetical protein